MTEVLMLYDEITPALAKTFVTEMSKLRPTDPVTVAINSPGGNVAAGDTIALSIDRHRGPTTARIDAIAASAASFIVMFCDRVTMAVGSHLMVHRPWAEMIGCADDLTAAGSLLKEVERRYCATYSVRSGMPENQMLELMKQETWLTAERAVELGFADEIDKSLATAKTVAKAVLRYKHVPREVRAMAGDLDLTEAELARQRRLREVRRQALRTQLASSVGPSAKDQLDLERGRRASARFRLHAKLDEMREEARRGELAVRAAAKRKLHLDYYYDANRIPQQQRRYDI